MKTYSLNTVKMKIILLSTIFLGGMTWAHAQSERPSGLQDTAMMGGGITSAINLNQNAVRQTPNAYPVPRGWEVAIDSSSTAKSDNESKKSKGYFGGLSFSTVTMLQFTGDVQNPDEVEKEDWSWGGPDTLGLFTSDVTNSWRIEFNPFEYRQKILGEFIGITTGIGFDWWRLSVNADRELYYDESTEQVASNVLPTDSLDVTSHRLDVAYIRVPLLVSVRTDRDADEGLHIEAGLVGGYRLVGQYFREYKTAFNTTTEKDNTFPLNPFSINARLSFGYGNVSVFGEAALLPTFEEVRSPAVHSGSVGIHFAFN